MTQTIGVISDTHGLVRPEAIDALRNVDLILHAGDIGRINVIDSLRDVAPVIAIRGNVDSGDWAAQFSDWETVNIDGQSLYLLHNLDELEVNPVLEGVDVVISGHSHQPEIFRKDGVLYLNPGSAGPRRFRLPVSLALMRVDKQQIAAEIVELI